MHTRWILLLLVSASLAGCADDGPGEGAGPTDAPPLAAGKGAIAGLLVDDRFRPIELTAESPTTEFQARGFVLLQETGAQTQTTPNGEFTFTNLPPGSYTLRVTATGHEATPVRVTVEAGAYSEASVVARRTASTAESIITEEYTAFVGCQASLPAVTAQCDAVLLDQSGDSSRQQFWTNYTGLPTEWVIIEMLSNKEASRDGALKVVIRNGTDDCYLVNWAITEGNYIKTWLHKGEVSQHDIELRNCMWTNEDRQLVQIWAQGLLKEETQPLVEPICLTGLCAGETAESRGVGVQAGVVVRFLVTVFLNQSDVDPEVYCALC